MSTPPPPTIVTSGAYAGFLRGGAQLLNFWDFGYTCREAASLC